MSTHSKTSEFENVHSLFMLCGRQNNNLQLYYLTYIVTSY